MGSWSGRSPASPPYGRRLVAMPMVVGIDATGGF
jgi:hypothetical protein